MTSVEKLKHAGFSAKEIMELVLELPCTPVPVKEPEETSTSLIGKICLCRSRNAGVFMGRVLAVNVLPEGHAHIVLDGADQLWSWTANNGITLLTVATTGITAGKVDHTTAQVALFEICEAVVCSDAAIASIQAKRVQK